MTRWPETRIIILTADAQRPDNNAVPLPKGLAGAVPQRSTLTGVGLRSEKSIATRCDIATIH